MQLTLLKEFKHNQYYVQNGGGWCGGVSEAALAFIAENLDMPFQPADAITHLKNFIDWVSFGFNKVGYKAPGTTTIAGHLNPSTPQIFQDMRADVRRRQAKYEFGGGGTPGVWETTFTGTGWAYLRLWVSEDTACGAIEAGSKWASGWFDGNVNHAGAVIWYGNEVCLFDPNVGAIHYTFTPNGGAADFVQAMDLALDLMYRRNDRMKGGRSCNVVSAKNTVGAPQ